jgi:ferredoxin-NADP reductase
VANASKVHCVVVGLRKNGDGVYIVELEPQGRIPRFRSGQFLHLTVDEFDPEGGFWPESRVFSIASSYGADRITIVYSVKGRYTRKMEETLKLGVSIWIKLPFGDFNIASRIRSDSDAVIIAGGTGITPFIPFLEGLAKEGAPSRRIRLYYGLRNPSQMLFENLLERCVESEFIEISLWFEEMEDTLIGNKRKASQRVGRLEPVIIVDECRNLRDPVFFLSGPPAMIANFKSSFASKGVDPDKIQMDEWE